MTHYGAGPKITAGQRTMSDLIMDLTGPTLVSWPVIFGYEHFVIFSISCRSVRFAL